MTIHNFGKLKKKKKKTFFALFVVLILGCMSISVQCSEGKFLELCVCVCYTQ